MLEAYGALVISFPDCHSIAAAIDSGDNEVDQVIVFADRRCDLMAEKCTVRILGPFFDFAVDVIPDQGCDSVEILGPF